MNKALAQCLSTMSLDDKLLAVEELWEDIRNEQDSLAIPEWHKSILDERLQEHQAMVENTRDGTPVRQAGSSWNQVKSRITGEPEV